MQDYQIINMAMLTCYMKRTVGKTPTEYRRQIIK